MEIMSQDPRIKLLASEAASKIKALTEIRQNQIVAIYQEFQEQAAILQGNNADELHNPSVTPIPSSPNELKESYDFTL